MINAVFSALPTPTPFASSSAQVPRRLIPLLALNGGLYCCWVLSKSERPISRDRSHWLSATTYPNGGCPFPPRPINSRQKEDYKVTMDDQGRSPLLPTGSRQSE